ncbi:class I SAM-dependent methyltransferase [Candidatus Leptofilum sp.]|uniref:class I SAM-dependent methyltransferase n=1 Tax=Candidatus Leptofilum sp. TaxID=3241576 RepID=UPI003B5C3EBE
MKREGDAFGQAVYDFYQGEQVIEIIERDDGYIGASRGPAIYFSPMEDWTENQTAVLSLIHDRVLDVGCGPGRVCLFLQNQGHNVVGIDNSPLAIQTAKLRGVQDARLLSITQASRNKLGIFGTIVMFGNNFGLFGNPKRAKWLLRRFYHMTTRNGRILTESRNIHKTDNPQHLAFHERNRQLGRLPGQLRLRVRYKTMIGPWFEYLMVSPEEMAEIVEGTGWHIAQIVPREDGVDYTAVIEKTAP